MTLDLTDNVALVTGASSGIGKAIALGLATQGTKLCLVGRNSKNLEAIAEEIGLPSAQVFTQKADLGLDEDITLLADRMRKQFERLDILIHCAGVISLGLIDDAAVQAFDRQFTINVRAPYLLTQALLPMLRSSQGQIVFINSTVGLKSRAGVSQYASTKHALKALADSLREEVNSDGLRVLSLFLGRTATPMQSSVHSMENRPYNPENLLQPEDIAALVIMALRLPRTAEVTEIKVRTARKTH